MSRQTKLNHLVKEGTAEYKSSDSEEEEKDFNDGTLNSMQISGK